MDRRFAYVIVALISALLFFLAAGYKGWECRDSILSQRCIFKLISRETLAALIVTAGVLILLAGIFLIILILRDDDWTQIISAVLAILAAIIGMAGVLYYLDHVDTKSPFFATIAMTLSIALAAILVFDVITSF